MLPDYLSKTSPNPKRAPWYVNTAPSYAGIFLWVAFYKTIAQDTLPHAGLGVCMAGIVWAALLSYALYYYAPAMLGMKTGFPLYVIGSSTFGTRGGYLMPGLLMGALQVGWLAVGTFVVTQFILSGFGSTAAPGSLPFIIIGVIWGYSMAFIGVMGIQYVAKLALYLNFVPLLMILVVFYQVSGGVTSYAPEPSAINPFLSFTLLIQIIVGFFATAGAAGADFGMSARNEKDVRRGGVVGIGLAIIVAAGLPLLSVAGARVLFPDKMASLTFDNVIAAIGGPVGTAMFFLFAIASIGPACFSSFIAGNSFSTMIPGVKRMSSTMAGMTVAIVLAVTGLAANLIGFFTIVGASFGPICGAITADYLLSGKKWAGPRDGINWAGYGSWAIGFLVGILPFLPIPETAKVYVQPAVVYSYVAGFVVYILLAKSGLEPKTVEMAAAAGR
ncbi:MAG: cytosine permease [Acidobacteria bacterium]|nr:cytosine permease [Acidobacteriota bacterium]